MVRGKRDAALRDVPCSFLGRRAGELDKRLGISPLPYARSGRNSVTQEARNLMRVKVRPLRRRGKNLPRSYVYEAPAHVGELSVSEARDHELARPVMRARLLDVTGTEADLLPQLSDVELIWVRNNEIRLKGIERIDDMDVAQSWSVEVLGC